MMQLKDKTLTEVISQYAYSNYERATNYATIDLNNFAAELEKDLPDDISVIWDRMDKSEKKIILAAAYFFKEDIKRLKK